jgi:hypothetical protein
MIARHFSVMNSAQVDKKITDDLNRILTTLLAEFPNRILALFLVGGLGRGEGGVLLEDNKIQVVNDYDLHMITRIGLNSQKVANVSKKLSIAINVKAIDVFVQPVYASIILRNTQYCYDLKHGSFLLYGNKKTFNLIPKSEKISKTEIEKLLFIRSWCFLGPIEKFFFEGKALSKMETFFLSQQLAKALLALEEGWLIHQNDYCSLYSEKLKRIKKYCCDYKVLEYFEWATNFKLRPSFTIDKNPIEHYFEIKKIFFKKMLEIINGAYNKNFSNWLDYSNWYCKRPDVLFNLLLTTALFRNFSYVDLIKLNISKVMLGAAFRPDGFDEALTKKVSMIFPEISNPRSVEDIEATWWNLRKFITEKTVSL